MESSARPGSNLIWPLVIGALALGGLRAWSTPVTSEESFHLVRAGAPMLRASLEAYSVPPGGEGAPVLGAIVTALGSIPVDGPQNLGRPAGSALLGLAAAVLAGVLVMARGPAIAILGAALLVLPPAFATSFSVDPAAALAGCLLAGALGTRVLGAGGALAPTLAWTACLASPAAWPAAIAVQATLDDPARRRVGSWIALPSVALAVALFSFALPPESRGEILRGLSGWRPSGEGLASSFDALLRVWAGGTLLLIPVVLPLAARRTLSPALHAPWAAAVLAAIALSGPEALRASTAALAPMTVLLLSIGVADLPQKAGASPAGPRRVVLFALALPVLLMIAGSSEDARYRRGLLAACAREAQIADFLRVRSRLVGAVLSERTGVLGALSERDVFPLHRGFPDADTGASRPEVVMFRDRGQPASDAELDLFEEPRFLTHYAPLYFRRGPTRAIADAVWVLRRPSAHAEAVDPDYGASLLSGWAHQRVMDDGAALNAFRAAAALEPAELGLAHEWLGIFMEIAGDPNGAEIVLVEARRDPTTARARGHLADRALTRGTLARADSLLSEALAWNEHEAELWGTRARLLYMAGDAEGALEDIQHAARLRPRSPAILANVGTILWATGDRDGARRAWDAAVTGNANLLRFLGDYTKAADDAPPPPLRPLFSMHGFAPSPQ